MEALSRAGATHTHYHGHRPSLTESVPQLAATRSTAHQYPVKVNKLTPNTALTQLNLNRNHLSLYWLKYICYIAMIMPKEIYSIKANRCTSYRQFKRKVQLNVLREKRRLSTLAYHCISAPAYADILKLSFYLYISPNAMDNCISILKIVQMLHSHLHQSLTTTTNFNFKFNPYLLSQSWIAVHSNIHVLSNYMGMFHYTSDSHMHPLKEVDVHQLGIHADDHPQGARAIIMLRE